MRTEHVFTAGVCIVRLALCARYFTSPSPVAWVFGFSEVWVCLLTLLALKSQEHDSSALGRLVPICYLAPLLLQPTGDANLWALPIMLVLAGCQLALRGVMGLQISVGVAKWGQLLDRGPFSYCRHPLAATEMLMLAVFFAAHPTLHNAIAAAIAYGTTILAVSLEERFLRRFAAYRDYACRVPNRFIPQP